MMCSFMAVFLVVLYGQYSQENGFRSSTCETSRLGAVAVEVGDPGNGVEERGGGGERGGWEKDLRWEMCRWWRL